MTIVCTTQFVFVTAGINHASPIIIPVIIKLSASLVTKRSKKSRLLRESSSLMGSPFFNAIQKHSPCVGEIIE